MRPAGKNLKPVGIFSDDAVDQAMLRVNASTPESAQVAPQRLGLADAGKAISFDVFY